MFDNDAVALLIVSAVLASAGFQIRMYAWQQAIDRWRRVVSRKLNIDPEAEDEQ